MNSKTKETTLKTIIVQQKHRINISYKNKISK